MNVNVNVESWSLSESDDARRRDHRGMSWWIKKHILTERPAAHNLRHPLYTTESTSTWDILVKGLASTNTIMFTSTIISWIIIYIHAYIHIYIYIYDNIIHFTTSLYQTFYWFNSLDKMSPKWNLLKTIMELKNILSNREPIPSLWANKIIKN